LKCLRRPYGQDDGDVLLNELFRQPADPPVRPDGRTAGILQDLWLGGMPLPRAATAAGLTPKAAAQTLRSLGLLPVEPACNTRGGSERVAPPRSAGGATGAPCGATWLGPTKQAGRSEPWRP